MFGSDILEVAIGMAFLFLFMSMIASALREAGENFLRHRSVDLEKGLTEMLRIKVAPLANMTIEQKKAAEEEWVRKLYDHPLVSSLYRGAYSDPDKKLPAYIPKQSFACAILDLVAKTSENGQTLSMASLRKALKAANPPNEIQRVVLVAMSTAGNDLDEVRKSVETWYDATMDRVSGWYAKRTSIFLFWIGFLAAVALNVDAITIAKSLITDRPLRQSIVAQAETYVKKADGQSNDDSKPKSFDALRSELDEVGYPIGWTSKDDWPMPAPQSCQRKVSTDKTVTYECSRENYVWMLLLALMGWLITAIAIMLGAPFWFDILNKFISLRSAVKPPKVTIGGDDDDAGTPPGGAATPTPPPAARVTPP